MEFYLVTPDLRFLSASAEGSIMPAVQFSDQTFEQDFGGTIAADNFCEVTPVAIDLLEESDLTKAKIWLSVDNLTLNDMPLSGDNIYMEVYDEDGYATTISFEAPGSLDIIVPPLYKKTRCTGSLFVERGREYALLLGIRDPSRPDALLAYGIYRFQAHPSDTEPDISIAKVEELREMALGNQRLTGLRLHVRNNGKLPVFASDITLSTSRSASKSVRDEGISTGLHRWLEEGELTEIDLPLTGRGRRGRIPIGERMYYSVTLTDSNERKLASFSGSVRTASGNKKPSQKTKDKVKQSAQEAAKSALNRFLKRK